MELTDGEAELLSRCTGQDTIVSRMLDMKRVGLSRMLAASLAGEAAYTLSEGLEDAAKDKLL